MVHVVIRYLRGYSLYKGKNNRDYPLLKFFIKNIIINYHILKILKKYVRKKKMNFEGVQLSKDKFVIITGNSCNYDMSNKLPRYKTSYWWSEWFCQHINQLQKIIIVKKKSCHYMITILDGIGYILVRFY